MSTNTLCAPSSCVWLDACVWLLRCPREETWLWLRTFLQLSESRSWSKCDLQMWDLELIPLSSQLHFFFLLVTLSVLGNVPGVDLSCVVFWPQSHWCWLMLTSCIFRTVLFKHFGSERVLQEEPYWIHWSRMTTFRSCFMYQNESTWVFLQRSKVTHFFLYNALLKRELLTEANVANVLITRYIWARWWGVRIQSIR